MNYFTEDQVKQLGWDNCQAAYKPENNKLSYEFTHDQLKTLMNLAVETAIGEPILFAVPDWEYRLDIYSGQTLCAGKNTAIHKLPLYSVKELEN